MRLVLPLSTLIASLFVVAPASAQKVRTKGFPIGEKSRIHTGVQLGMSFDSNPDRTTTAVEDWRGSIRPGVVISVPGEGLQLSLGSQLAIEHYFGISNAAQDSFVGGHVNASLRAGSSRSVIGFEFRDTFTRTPTFFNEEGEEGLVAVQERRFKAWSNRGHARAVFRPGGGALELRLGYLNRLEFYDDLPDSQRHGIAFEARLKFLPKTAAVFSADTSFFSASDGSDRRAFPYNVSVGLHGQITTRLNALLDVGFGDTLVFQDGFFTDVTGSSFRTVVARAKLGYSFGQGINVSGGYQRTVHPVILLDAYSSDALSLRFRVPIGDRVSIRAFGEYEFRTYGAGNRDAQIATVDTRVGYHFFDWLQAEIGYQLIRQAADETGIAAQDLLLEDYTRHLALLLLNFRY